MKEYDYPKEFEDIWKTIPGRGNGNNKETGYRLYTRMLNLCSCEELSEQCKAKDKWIKDLLSQVEVEGE